MQRRTFMAGMATVMVASHAAEGQHAGRTYRVGILSPEDLLPGLLDAFREGLRELGYVDGRNIVLESRNARGKNEKLPVLADELVRMRADVIVAVNTSAALAAKNATTTVPIVLLRVADPVKSGLVSSLSHPGGNVTGLSFMPDAVAGKQLELLKEVLPRVARVAALWYADNPGTTINVRAMEASSSPLGLHVLAVPIRDPNDLPAAFQAVVRGRSEAVVVSDDAWITKHRLRILELAATHSLPVISLYKDFPEAGGLLSYGASPIAVYRRAAHYVDRLLKGVKPRDLPIEQPTKFDLVINLRAARALKLTIPPSLLLRADQVIE